jgi:hypothetical protein
MYIILILVGNETEVIKIIPLGLFHREAVAFTHIVADATASHIVVSIRATIRRNIVDNKATTFCSLGGMCFHRSKQKSKGRIEVTNRKVFLAGMIFFSTRKVLSVIVLSAGAVN